ncbi:MAG: LPS assembly lipoprotein LptE [Nitrospiraceae bacterium]
MGQTLTRLISLSRLGAVVLLVTSCGYQFRVEGPGPVIGGGPTSLYEGPPVSMVIPTFENKTFEPNLELKYTSYARTEFSAGSEVRVVKESDPSQFILKGQILSVVIPSINFTQTTTLESRVTVTVRAAAKEVSTGKVVWTQDATASSEFFVTDDLQFNRVLQDRALEQAGRYVAQDLAAGFISKLDVVQQSRSGGQPAQSSPAGTTQDGPP